MERDQTDPIILPLRREREAFIDHFRIHGELLMPRAAALELRLETLLPRVEGTPKAQALFELATIRRMTGRFREAVPSYEKAAALALLHDDIQTALDSWIGIARAHAYGTKDHGAATRAFERAVEVAGDDPTRTQRYAIADYASQLESGRGELEAALLNALEASRLAADDADRFYADLAVGHVLQAFAESCDYRRLTDALTGSDEDDADGYGACRRAVRAAERVYREALQHADALGWRFLGSETQGFIKRVRLRLSLINQRAQFGQIATASVFTATDAADVLVNEEFAAGASELAEVSVLGKLIESVVGSSPTEDARSLYLLGQREDLEGKGDRALDYYRRAVAKLEDERTSIFDLRRRGTVIENRPELVRDLALRLLALGRYAEAFQAFESIRARGLGEFADAIAAGDLDDAERAWLARLADLESRESSLVEQLVQTTIAGVPHSRAAKMTERLDALRKERRAHVSDPAFADTIERLATRAHAPATLDALRDQVAETGIPTLLYWVTPTNVVVWAISPGAMEIKTVFLPEVAVTEKTERLVDSVRLAYVAFDAQAARELHAYLIQPFLGHLEGGRVMIVPQGPLVTLPFEVLLDASTDRYLIEDIVVSYAPNATFALRAMEEEPRILKRVDVLYDDELEAQTGEISRIDALADLTVKSRRSQDLSRQAAMDALAGAAAVHVLLHGDFDFFDPLQSAVSLNRPGGSPEENHLTAADLLAVDWSDTHLAVFSSCEGARLNRRISNEVYGLSWPLFIGGVDAILMSRWRVEAATNAEWMAKFYEKLAAEGASPATAAAEAMRSVVSTDRQHPYLWAGPQLFGR